jgi:tellurite resistance protein TehA-like permease
MSTAIADNALPGGAQHGRMWLAVRDLNPSYFALVMATGIVSIGLHLQGVVAVACVLFAFNIAAYVVLVGMTLVRACMFRQRFFTDMASHQRGPGFFTTVASSSVLGIQFIRIANDYTMATVLWGVSLLLWLGLTYTIFTAFIIKEEKPSLAEGITGGWLLAIVATQAVAVLGSFLAAHWPQPVRVEMNFFALSMWLWGGMLYIWMISLIFYRYTFFRFSPGDLAPPYWINMGAMAISTLAGARLILNAPDAPFIRSLLPFLKGFTVFYWATGTWWIPMLLILGVWRHIYKRFPLEYDPLYWGAVFPLGMYSVCTLNLAHSLELPFLLFIPKLFICFASAAWLATFIGLIRRLLGVTRGAPPVGLQQAR